MINAAWGLGENVVQGTVEPDKYLVFKPLLANPRSRADHREEARRKEPQDDLYRGRQHPTRNVPTTGANARRFVFSDAEILALARWASPSRSITARPMDMEWAKDGETGALFIVQARPETVQSRERRERVRTYRLKPKGRELARASDRRGDRQRARRASSESAARNRPLRQRCDPGDRNDGPRLGADHETAPAIITDHGGTTSHAAIVSRELGLPAIVGTGNATARASMTAGRSRCPVRRANQGFIYDGRLRLRGRRTGSGQPAGDAHRMMLNIASPAAALRWWRLPAKGIGLARMEFIVNNLIKVHPMALVHFEQVKDPDAQAPDRGTDAAAMRTRPEYFVDRLAQGIAKSPPPSTPIR